MAAHTVPGTDPDRASGSPTSQLRTLVILSRQHLSLNEPFGGDLAGHTRNLATRTQTASTAGPSSRHIPNRAPARSQKKSGSESGRCARRRHDWPLAASAGSVLTTETGSLFSLGIKMDPFTVQVGGAVARESSSTPARRVNEIHLRGQIVMATAHCVCVCVSVRSLEEDGSC